MSAVPTNCNTVKPLMKYITIHLYLPMRGCANVTALYIICTALFPPALWVWCAWNHQRAIYWIAPLSVLSFKSHHFHNALPRKGHHINQDKVNKSIRSLDSIIALSFPSHIFPRERAQLRSLKLKHTLSAFPFNSPNGSCEQSPFTASSAYFLVLALLFCAVSATSCVCLELCHCEPWPPPI